MVLLGEAGLRCGSPAFCFERTVKPGHLSRYPRMTAPTNATASGPVMFFDGECGLCTRLVRMLLWLDRVGRLRFAPLQGAAAQAYLRARGLPTEDFSTLVFVPDWPVGTEQYLLRTDGVIAALRAAGRPGPAALLTVVPRGLRDAGYRIVARLRYRLFGPWRASPMAHRGMAGRFLP